MPFGTGDASTKPSDYYLWNRSWGSREGVHVVQEKNGFVQIERVRQSFYKWLTSALEEAFSHKTSRPIVYASVLSKKTYSPVAPEKFESEKTALGQLVQERRSIEDILERAEKDFAPEESVSPKSDPEPVQAPPSTPAPNEAAIKKQEVVQELRAKLQSLLEEIEEEERAIVKNEKENALLAPLNQIKVVASQRFKQLNELDQTKETDSFTEALKLENEQWESQFHTLREIRVKDIELHQKAEKISGQLKSFSKEIQKIWEDGVELWEKSPRTTAEQFQDHAANLDALIEKVAAKCQSEQEKSIGDAKDYADKEFGAILPIAFSNQERKSAFYALRAGVLSLRLSQWGYLGKTLESIESDMDAINDLQQRIQEESLADQALASILDHPAQEGYLDRIYNYLSSFLPSNSNIPPGMFPFNQTAAESIELVIQNTIQVITEVLDTDFPANQGLADKLNALTAQTTIGSFKKITDDFIDQFKGAIQKKEVLTEEEEQRNHRLLDACNKITGLKRALPILLDCQDKNRSDFKKGIRKTYSHAFNRNAHPSILKRSWPIWNGMLRQTSHEESEIGAVLQNWQQTAKEASKDIATLHILEKLSSLHHKYRTYAEEKQKEVDALTGPEKESGQQALDFLTGTVSSLKEIDELDTLNQRVISQYERELKNAETKLQNIFTIENKKRAFREQIFNEIDRFAAVIDDHEKKLSAIEEQFKTTLKEARQTLDLKRKELLSWKEKGRLPNSLFSHLPQSYVQGAIYYAPSNLPLANSLTWTASLNDLDLRLCPFYLERVKTEIEIYKSELTNTYIQQMDKSLQTFKQEEIKTKNQITSLTAAKGRTSLTTKDLPGLQVFNSKKFSTELEELATDQKKTISNLHTPYEVHRSLEKDINELKRKQSSIEKAEVLALLVQLKRSQNDPAAQNEIKGIILKMITTKMRGHQKAIKKQLDELEKYPEIHKAASRLLETSEREFQGNIKSASSQMQGFVEALTKNKDLPELDLINTSAKDLQTCETAVEKLVATASSQLELIRNAHNQALRATEELSRKISQAEAKMRELDGNDQLIQKDDLANLVNKIEKEMKKLGKKEEKPSRFTYLESFLQATPETEVMIALDRCKKQLGNWISIIDSALNLPIVSEKLSIPRQLGMGPSQEVEAELRKRLDEQQQAIFAACETNLAKYQEGLNGFLKKYIPDESPLFRKMNGAIQKKRDEVEQFKIAFVTTPQIFDTLFGYLFTTRTQVSGLKPHQLERYHLAISQLQQTHKAELDKAYCIDSLTINQAKLDKAFGKAERNIQRMENQGQFLYAFELRAKIDAIKEKINAKWADQVTKIERLEQLAADLTVFKREVETALHEIENRTQTPLENEQQMELFINLYKTIKGYTDLVHPHLEEVDPEKKDRIVNDIQFKHIGTGGSADRYLNQLKEKIVADIRTKLDEYQEEMNTLAADIKEISSLFGLPKRLQEQIADGIDKQKKEYSLFNYKFEVPILFGALDIEKTIDQLTAEEIATIKPDTLLEQSIKKSEAARIPLQLYRLRESYAKYKIQIKKAELAKSQLLSRGQIAYAAELQDTIEAVKDSITTWAKANPIKNDSDLKTGSVLLDTKAIELEYNQNLMENKPDLTPVEQSTELKKGHALASQLKSEFVKSIRKKVSEDGDMIKQYQTTLKELTSQLQMPFRWYEYVDSQLENASTQLQKVASGSMNNNQWKPLEILELDEMEQIHQNLDTLHENIEAFADDYCLVSLQEQLKYYKQQQTTATSLIGKYHAELQVDSAEEIDKLRKTTEADLRSSCDNNLPEQDIAEGMQKLVTDLLKATDKLAKGIDEIQLKEPKTVATLLLETNPNSPLYKERRAALHKIIDKKISGLQKELGDYLKKLDHIQKEISKLSRGGSSLHLSFRKSITDKIDKEKGRVKDLGKGLSIRDPAGSYTFKPFDEQTAEELLRYETLVFKTVGAKPEENGLRDPECLLAKIESRLGLEQVEKLVKEYKKAKNQLNRNIGSLTNTHAFKDKKAVFEHVEKTALAIVQHTINKLDNAASAENLSDALNYARAITLRANEDYVGRFNQERQISIDSWINVYHYNELNKNTDGPYEASVWHILCDGFCIPCKTEEYDPELNYRREVQSTIQFSGLKPRLDQAKKELDRRCRDFSSVLRRALSQGIADADPRVQRNKKAIADLTLIQAEIDALLAKIPLTEAGEVDRSTLPPTLKTFQELLDFRSDVFTVTGKGEELMERLDFRPITEDPPRENAHRRREARLLL